MRDELSEIRRNLTRSVHRARSIHRIVMTDEFREAWEAVPAKIRQEAMGYINGNNRERLNRWVKDHAPTELGMKSLRELREIGKKMNILYCSRMDKGTLLMEIVNHERSRATSGNGQGNQEVAHGDATVDATCWDSAGERGPATPEA